MTVSPLQEAQGRMWQAANQDHPCPVCAERPERHTDEEWAACTVAEQAALERYGAAIASGLSDFEARDLGWPAAPPKVPADD